VIQVQSLSSDSCTFKLSDLPVPSDSIIIGDVRENSDCFATSFQSSRPPNLSDPSGVR